MHLTKRERQVLRLFCYSNKEIANILTVEESTIKTHVKNILRKFKTSTKSKALIKALKLGCENLFMIETDLVDLGFWNNKGDYKIDMQKVVTDPK